MECTAAGVPVTLSRFEVARSGLLQQMSDTAGAFDLPFLPEHVRAWQAVKPQEDTAPDFDALETALKVRVSDVLVVWCVLRRSS